MRTIMKPEDLSWRVWGRLDAERAGQVLDAHFTSEANRTPEQANVLAEVAGVDAKNARRQANLAIATGVRVRTANGVAYYRGDGQGHRSK